MIRYEIKTDWKERVRENVLRLSRGVFGFDNEDKDEKDYFNKEVYYPGIVSIATSLDRGLKQEYTGLENIGFILSNCSEYETFDCRKLDNYKSGVLKNDSSFMNQGLIDLCKHVGLENNTGVERFVLYNALKYLKGKRVSVFSQTKRELKGNSLDEMLLIK